MSGKSAIEWTDATWNPVTGCSKVSPGCAHCYAETLSLRFGHSKKPWTPENAAENVVLHPERLDQPLRWRAPRMVFVNSMSDLFHEEIPSDFVWRVFDVMRLAERHTFQVLTKRPERAVEIVSAYYRYTTSHNPVGGDQVEYPLTNVWLGVSIENSRYTWRADVLREIPAAVRFISAEPLLGSLFEQSRARPGQRYYPKRDWAALTTPPRKPLDLTGVDWVIAGGESGHGARPMDPEWARELRDACLAAVCARCGDLGWYADHENECYEDGACSCSGVQVQCCDHRRPAFFFKQWGGRTPKAGGRLLDGCEWNEMPATVGSLPHLEVA